ncbi:hypothetical protein NA57DRAFT_58161 [Rhizodiscina lignyota]|uniref:MYND-type domain-containing protein n=1 Tax=Rhizodiscina lignyota TaxID=1504668 RepID=A0A9P4M599_9PEZI|nr:hypothetical protein NA57DRAFT_58161 [Rhizodiscina lignyota]
MALVWPEGEDHLRNPPTLMYGDHRQRRGYDIDGIVGTRPGPDRSLTDGCGKCNQPCRQGTSFLCSQCGLIRYCSNEHLSAHRDRHGHACEVITMYREQLASDERVLRRDFAPVDPFNMVAGRFWDERQTQKYMLTRMDLIRAMRRLRTKESVEAQLEQVQGLLKLSRNDGIMARNTEPQLLLRLDRDQECYDFLKRWRFIGKAFNFDWDDVDYLSTDYPTLIEKQQDAFEPVEYLCDHNVAGFDGTILEHNIAATLLKIKLILDLGALQKATIFEDTTLGSALPREIQDVVRSYIPQSPIVANNRHLWECRDHAASIGELNHQIDMLYITVKDIADRYWPVMLDHYASFDERFRVLDRTGGQECPGGLRNSYDSWVETPGAMAFLRWKFNGDPDSRPLTWSEFL